MPESLAERALSYGSVAVAGLAKNVGKTVTLNYLLRKASEGGGLTAVTSIGVDGETTDRVGGTAKPEITVYRGMLFATCESYYRQRRLEAEVLDLGRRHTALGRIVTGRALSSGKVLLAGPSETTGLQRLIRGMMSLGADCVIVDGALSRLSQASPAVTDAMILATGAALSPSIDAIVKHTAYVCSLVELPEAQGNLAERLYGLDEVCEITDDGDIHASGVGSALELERLKAGFLEKGRRIYVPGMVGDRFLKFLGSHLKDGGIELVVKDFTRIFAQQMTLREFEGKGGRISVLKRPRLLGVTVNPWSPAGYTVDKDQLQARLQQRLTVPVTNIMR